MGTGIQACEKDLGGLYCLLRRGVFVHTKACLVALSSRGHCCRVGWCRLLPVDADWGVFCAMECALSQCIPNVYRAIIYIDNLNRFFKLGLTVGEFFYFFEVRRCEKYAQLCMSNAKLFDSFSQGDHVWNADVLEISSKWEGEVDNGPLILTTYCNVKDITQKLDLGPDMAKLRQALNIPARFRELHWLLSEH
ncbi:unnamed protein product [Prunus armeniaca]